MAARGPRGGGGGRGGHRVTAHAPTPPGTPRDDDGPGEGALVRVHDLAGRPRGIGFVADHHGTVITSHEAVDGLPTLVLRADGDRSCLVTAEAVTALPDLDLALVPTDGLGAQPLPVTTRERVEAGTYVRLAAGRWREARVLAATTVTYAATDRFRSLDDALELAIGTDGQDALRLGGGAAGGPVLDAGTGAVVGVLGTALRNGHRDTGFAVPLRPAPPGPLADLLTANAATVPAYGADLNLAGVLELTATSVGQDGPPGTLAGHVGRTGGGATADVLPVERAETARQFSSFTRAGAPAAVLGLVGAPGSGRTTELAALAARRGRGAEPAPTLWLRGADLRDDDTSVADAARRAVARAARIVAASGSSPAPDLGDLGPDRLARVADAAGRPLLLLLDGPEEMPPVLAHRLREWTQGTAAWLRTTGARLVVACREEYWERAGAEFPPELLYDPREPAAVPGAQPSAAGEPPCARLGDFREDEARTARARYRVPEDALTGPDARHPLTVRLLSEVLTALPDAPGARVDRDDVLSAHLDLMCLRIAVRLAAGNGLRGTAVRRLAAKVCGQVHEAARRSLGPGQGELDRAAFEATFPWGQAPARLGGGTGWASAVLTEGLLVPAGAGYRFAHEEFADWIQGMHLDLDEALRALVHQPTAPAPDDSSPDDSAPDDSAPDDSAPDDSAPDDSAPDHAVSDHAVSDHAVSDYAVSDYRVPDCRVPDHPAPDHPVPDHAAPDDSVPVPHHRIGPVVEALLLLARDRGTRRLALRLEELARALHADPDSWWAARLLTETLRRVPDATPYLGVLRQLADDLVASSSTGRGPLGPLGPLGPAFWTALPVPEPERLDLLRRLLPADGPPQDPAAAPAPRFLDAASRLLAAAPTVVQPLLTRWFDDDRPLPATPHATVAKAAQALLHTHRHLGLDDLTELLVDRAHPRADELLGVLAEDEPSAVCRAVDRWAHDERPARRVAAGAYGLRAAPHVRTEADRELLRYAALTLLARPTDATLHGAALALLVRDPRTRARHLPQALRHFAAGDPRFPPSALVAALTTHPEEVLDAFRQRLSGRGDAGDALRTLADVTTPPLARRVAVLVREAVERRPETADDVAAYVDRRLDQGPEARAVLLPLVTGLLDGGPEEARAALAAVLAAPGAPASRPLRRELLDFLLAHEQAPAVLDALLHTIAGAGVDAEEVRDLVHRTGLLLVRTPDGAARFDRGLVDLGRQVPGFAARMAGWLNETPQAWSAVVGPSTRRMIENLAGVRVPA